MKAKLEAISKEIIVNKKPNFEPRITLINAKRKTKIKMEELINVDHCTAI
jgi:hypothetical protein